MNTELIKAARAEANCKQFYKQYNDCNGCLMPHKANPSYQRMCVDFDEEVLPQLVDALEAADKREEAQRWISVEERLPEHDQDVLAITKAGNLSVGQNIITCTFCKPRNEKHGLFYLPYTMGRTLIVTHWQPLPQPPQKG